MKITSILILIFMLTSCVVHDHGRRGLPPGQAKKVYGGSARYYAPGQVKKRVYYYDYNDNSHYKHKGHKKHYKD